MSIAVVTVAAGGLPVVDVTATTPKLGLPVTEAANGRGIPVTKVTLPRGGMPVTFVAGPGPVYVGPGDLNTGATAWWGLRAYSAAAAGSAALDVVRASDSATQTINTLSDGSLDVAALTTFLTATTGKVSKLYDQTGNGFDVVQATPANRPAITLNAIGALPAITFNGSSTSMASAASVSAKAMPFTMNAVAKRTTAGSQQGIWLANAGAQAGMLFSSSNNAFFIYAAGDAPTAVATDNVLHTLFGVFNGASSILYVDGVSTPVNIGAGAATFVGNIVFGNYAGSSFFNGILAEAGVWPYQVTP